MRTQLKWLSQRVAIGVLAAGDTIMHRLVGVVLLLATRTTLQNVRNFSHGATTTGTTTTSKEASNEATGTFRAEMATLSAPRYPTPNAPQPRAWRITKLIAFDDDDDDGRTLIGAAVLRNTGGIAL
jgi:hypothetical protein